MKILLTILNAKYIHSSLALRSLAAFCKQSPHSLVIKEFTINDHEHTILSSLFKEAPDVVCFSCYIWNRSITLSLVDSLKKILPGVKTVLGGPEVTGNEAEIMANHPVDIIVTGEGEEPFSLLLDYFSGKLDDLATIPRITYRDMDGRIRQSSSQTGFIGLDCLPFAYENDIDSFKHKIIYYETSRGCPFSCAYCLSGTESRLRYLSLDRCFKDLQYFLNNKVRQIKFIDRTFNCNKTHALEIWRYLIANDNGHTNFHFEISADLLDDEMLALLASARTGLFQFEIGVQSTHSPTLHAIRRKTNLQTCFQNIKKIIEAGNIHTHVDLIAGLPLENLTAFKESFNAVYDLQADYLQLGFLKLLHGSALRNTAPNYGIVYKNAPPYEVLFTADLPYQDLIRLKAIEEILSIYYNSGRFRTTLSFVVGLYLSPFAFYDKLATYFEDSGYAHMGHTKWKLYDIMYAFLSHNKTADMALLRDLLVFDMYKNEHVPNLPHWADLFPTDAEVPTIKQALLRVPGNERNNLKRRLHVQKFAYDIVAFALGETVQPQLCDSFTLFDYTQAKGGPRFEKIHLRHKEQI